MRPILNLISLIVIAVLIVSLAMRATGVARVINAVGDFFAQSFQAILGETPVPRARRGRGRKAA